MAALPARASSAHLAGGRTGAARGPYGDSAYWASPWPKDQFSLATSTMFTNTSSPRRPGLSPSNAVIRRNSAFF